jgi:uncharacterized RDD family membrane protein YckC
MSADAINPYAPPTADLIDTNGVELQRPDAGKGLRFLNFFIDYLAAIAFSTLGFTLYFLVSPASENDMDGLETYLAGILFGFLWHFGNELFRGRGLSKLLTGTQAVMLDGSPLTVRSAFTRSLCRLIPFEPFSFLGSEPRGWHDTITQTRVINLRDRGIPKRTGQPRPGSFTPPGVKRPPVRQPVDQPPPQTLS